MHSETPAPHPHSTASPQAGSRRFPRPGPGDDRSAARARPLVRYGRPAAVAVLPALIGLAVLAGPASSDADPANCLGTSHVVTLGGGAFGTTSGARLSSDGGRDLPTSRTYVLGEPIQAGVYDIDSVSYDGYQGREATLPQSVEKWLVELLDADGNVVTATTATGDIPDEVAEATVADELGRYEIGTAIVEVRTVHGDLGTPGINSVDPVCVGFTRVEDPDGGTGNEGPVQQPPTAVGGVVQERPPAAPPAAPQVADPTFAG